MSETVSPGLLANFTLTLSSLNGLVGMSALYCGPLPPHSSCTVTPGRVTLPNSTAIAEVTIDLENKGIYSFTFLANDGTLNHTATIVLTVK